MLHGPNTLILLLLSLTAPLLLVAQERAGAVPLRRGAPPVAPAGDHADAYHGIRVADPYRWMEELDGEATRRWVTAQDAWTRAFVGDAAGRDLIRETIARAATARRFSVPLKAGARYFYQSFQTTGGALQPEALWWRTDAGTEPRKALDAEALRAQGGGFSLVTPNRDGTLVAWGFGAASSRWLELRIRDLATGTDRPERLTGLVRGSSTVLWRADGSGFWYTAFDRVEGEDQRLARLGNERLRFHRLGTAQEEDPVVFAPPAGAGWSLRTSLTEDGRFLVIEAKEPASQGNRVYVLDLAGSGTADVLVPGFDATVRFVGSRGDWLWFQTDAGAPRGRVVAIHRTTPTPDRWRELIPQRDETITNWLGVSVVAEHFLVGYLSDARHVVRVHAADGTFRYDLALPQEYGSLWSGFLGRQHDPEAFYSVSGLADPGTVYRLDVRTGRSTVFQRPEVSYDPARYVTRQVTYPGRDGTPIPMFLVHRRDLDRTRPAPTFMYGYAFDWAAAPWFQPHMVAWMDLGGVWALPNTRGGTEYGEAWNAAGSRLQKQTAIDDYLAATEWLIAEGITTRQLMVANTSSAGGAVGGAAIVQRPELYAAAVLDYPLLDMLRYHRFTGAQSWSHEYGTTENAEEFRALLAYSPYHTVRDNVCYPATLVAPGELDEITPPLHAYKFVARLQAAQACDAPIALRVAWGAGHSSGATTNDAVEMWTDQIAFLARVLGLGGAGPRAGGDDG